MDDQQRAEPVTTDHGPWKRIAGQVIASQDAKSGHSASAEIKTSFVRGRRNLLTKVTHTVSKLFVSTVHRAARAINKPVIDIGREYSVSALNDRINTLEEILVRQWTQLKDSELLTPNDEVKQYIAACHVARQYDRITVQLLSSRLGISESKSSQLLDQLMDDEIITESYTITYHDVRRSMIEPTIERRLADFRSAAAKEASPSPAAKKH